MNKLAKLKKLSLSKFWNWLPKPGKVAAYMFVAAILDKIAIQISPDMLTVIPVEYRLTAFNFLEVMLVEGAKALKTRKKK